MTGRSMRVVGAGAAVLQAAAIVIALLMAAIVPARADGRVALVIGNSAYESVTRLDNPSRDAAAIAETLKRLGFDTILALDQTHDALANSLRAFGRKASGADIAAVYYAGHGMEAGGQNYLIPVDAKLETDQDIDYELISLELVLRAVSGAKKLRLVMLDACRNNPFAAQIAQMESAVGTRSVARGFVRVEPSNNTLVAYAAKAGTTAEDGAGAHSPFAAALLENLPMPGQEVRIVFGKVRDSVLASTANQQEPFVYGSLGGDPIYLVPQAPALPPADPAAAGAAPMDPKAMELGFWNSIQGSEDPAFYEAYLKAFPQGTFAGLAQAQLQRLKTTGSKGTGQLAALLPPGQSPAPPLVVEPLSGTYVALQNANIRAEPNAAAKVLGRLAEDDAIAVTGRLKDGVWYRVDRDDAVAFVSAKLLRKVDEDELKAWHQLLEGPKLEAAQAFLERYPDGHFKAKAEVLKASLQPEVQPPPAAAPPPPAAPAAPSVPSVQAPAPAALEPPTIPDAIKGGDVYTFLGRFQCTCSSAGAGSRNYILDGKISGIQSSGDNRFAGKLLNARAGIVDVAITQVGDTLIVTDAGTSALELEIKLERQSPGKYTGSGWVRGTGVYNQENLVYRGDVSISFSPP